MSEERETKSYRILFETIFNVKNFIGICEKFVGDIKVFSGVYCVNGKSVLGIFSLDLTKEVVVTIISDKKSVLDFECELYKYKIIT